MRSTFVFLRYDQGIGYFFTRTQGDPQDFERLLMVEPLLTVRDLRADVSDEVTDSGELLRFYGFNISPGIVLRVMRFLDALVLMEENAGPPQPETSGDEPSSSSAPPVGANRGVMGFDWKSSVRKGS